LDSYRCIGRNKMPSSYVNNLRLEEIATGEQSGTWGDTTNTNLELVGQALGYGTRAIANASTDNITIADGTADADRSMYLKLTGGGQACTVTLLPNTSSKMWIMENATSYTLTFTQGSGANVAIPAGQTKMIFADGLGAGAVVYELGTIAVQNIQADGTVTVGIDDTGYDVTFFGATTGKKLFWDESADTLNVAGTTALDGSLSVTGVTSNADGSAAAPSITNTGDTNTGIFFPAADTVGVAVGGTEVWRYGSNPTTAKNLIINGAMAVDQRSAETRTGLGAASAYHIDQWKYDPSGSPTGRFTLANTAVPSLGVGGSIKSTVTTADAALDAAALYLWTQYVEAQNLQHLNYGQSDAKAITVSFYADAPAGNYTFKVLSQDASRTYATAFALAGAGLEKVTITVPGDTSGGITNDTGQGLQFMWTMAGGSGFTGGTTDAWTAEANNTYAAGNNVNMFDTNTNVFQLGKVQVEVGSVATDFEHEDIGTTLVKCQRYFERTEPDASGANIASGVIFTASDGSFTLPHKVRKRAPPTMTFSAAATFNVVEGDSTAQNPSSISSTADSFAARLSVGLSSAALGGGELRRNGTNTTIIDASAEL
jgi:hypothetical protein